VSRQQEIEQGLRHESGALAFPLNVEEYSQGFIDYRDGAEPPRMTTTSYDLGRAYGARKAEADADFKAWMKAEDERREAAMRAALKDRPDLLADYLAKIAEIRRDSDTRPKDGDAKQAPHASSAGRKASPKSSENQ
jgi:hypothetical protein